MKKESKKFISFKSRCEFFINRCCTATNEQMLCYQKKCKLFKSKYKRTYFRKTRQVFDSDEELEFYCWLMEAQQNNLVLDVKYDPICFKLSGIVSAPYEEQLKTKIKICSKHLFAKHSYSPDFGFDVIDKRLCQYFINPTYISKKTILVDVKGGWSRDNSQKAFSINQKWVWKIYQEYVEKVVPEKLFKMSWVPEISRLSPVKKDPVKKYIGVDTIGMFLDKY